MLPTLLTERGNHFTREFEEIINGCPHVISCHNITGSADFLLQVVARDLDDYSHFVDTVLRRIPRLVNICSNLSLRELKSSARLPRIERKF